MFALRLFLLIVIFLFSSRNFAADFRTNAVSVHSAPSWVTERRVERIVDQIQAVLEWDIRRIDAYFHTNAAEFQKVHGFDQSVVAVAKKKDNCVHVGPKVTSADFDQVFGHELVNAYPKRACTVIQARCSLWL
jgi:hypothetical protein